MAQIGKGGRFPHVSLAGGILSGLMFSGLRNPCSSASCYLPLPEQQPSCFGCWKDAQSGHSQQYPACPLIIALPSQMLKAYFAGCFATKLFDSQCHAFVLLSWAR